MLRRFCSHLTYANVMVTLLAFIVLGGGAYAATKIGPNDIAKNAVRSKHIKDGQVKRADLNTGEKTLWAVVRADGTIAHQSGGITAKTIGSGGGYVVDFNRDVSALSATGIVGREIVDVVLCNGETFVGYDCSPDAPNDSQHVEVDVARASTAPATFQNDPFYIAALPK